MTVVCFREGRMASDSSCFADETHVHGIKKIWRVGGGLVGGAGNVADLMRFVRWLRDGAAEDEYPRMTCLHAIVVDPRGRVSCYEQGSAEPVEITDRYCAVGAGAEVALGAMHAGASARGAVLAAIAHSGRVKAPVRVYKLKQEK